MIKLSPSLPSASSKMTFQRLPVELFLMIAAKLDTVDRLCLRITCRAFKGLLDFRATNPLQSRESHGQGTLIKLEYASENHRHLSYLERLFKPGNVFHNRDASICSGCFRIQSTSKFPMQTYLIDKHPVCDECIVTLITANLGPGHKQSYGDHWRGEYCTCRECGIGQRAFHMQHHDGEEDKPGLLCKPCHRSTCVDPWCSGHAPNWVTETAEGYCHFFGPDPDRVIGAHECDCLLCETRENRPI